jgi:AAA+ superfamily predicted ATPase
MMREWDDIEERGVRPRSSERSQLFPRKTKGIQEGVTKESSKEKKLRQGGSRRKIVDKILKKSFSYKLPEDIGDRQQEELGLTHHAWQVRSMIRFASRLRPTKSMFS